MNRKPPRSPEQKRLARNKAMRKYMRKRRLAQLRAEGVTDNSPDNPEAVRKEAIDAGMSIVSRSTLRRPSFKVRTPSGVWIETLEPDLI